MLRIVHRPNPCRWRVRLGLAWLFGSALLLATGKITTALGDEFHVQNWRLEDGLANGGCSGSGQPVATRTADGRLWFPNYEGITVLDPSKVNPTTSANKVLVESVLERFHKFCSWLERGSDFPSPEPKETLI